MIALLYLLNVWLIEPCSIEKGVGEEFIITSVNVVVCTKTMCMIHDKFSVSLLDIFKEKADEFERMSMFN